jgi:hypothetical protein
MEPTPEASDKSDAGKSDAGEPEPPEPASNRGPVAALVVVLVLVVVGWLLTQALHKNGNLQDCVASGRTNCAPINQ